VRRCGVACLLAFTLAAAPVAAHADGDPASDFLLAQSTFLSPFDGHVASTQATRLVQLLSEAQRKGLGLKVAVIVTSYDLGAVPILFDKPKVYAQFLAEEDFYYWKDELLVVMPDGYGLYKASGSTSADAVPAADRAAIAALPPPDTDAGTKLVIDAERAVELIARRHGIVLTPGGGGSAGTGSQASERIEIAAGVVLAALVGVGARFALRRARR
jgi:hypothetical protein